MCVCVCVCLELAISSIQRRKGFRGGEGKLGGLFKFIHSLISLGDSGFHLGVLERNRHVRRGGIHSKREGGGKG